jgi:hypothetical protein
MTRLEELVVGLADGLPGGLGDARSGVRVESTVLDLVIPIEVHVDAGGMVRASLPRGRLATGWDVPHSRLQLSFDRRPAEPPATTPDEVGP